MSPSENLSEGMGTVPQKCAPSYVLFGEVHGAPGHHPWDTRLSPRTLNVSSCQENPDQHPLPRVVYPLFLYGPCSVCHPFVTNLSFLWTHSMLGTLKVETQVVRLSGQHLSRRPAGLLFLF